MSRTGVWVVVVAAGTGDRFGGPKQLATLGDRRVLDHSVAAASAVADGVVVVVAADRVDQVEPTLGAPVVCVGGGATRSASVRAGLEAIPADVGVVLVHDAARPLASVALFDRVIAAVDAGAAAVVPAVAVTDSIRHRQRGVVDRSDLVAVQTPQGFPAAVLRRAHAARGEATDDAALVEADGGKVVIVEGEATNLKITHAHDLAWADTLLKETS